MKKLVWFILGVMVLLSGCQKTEEIPSVQQAETEVNVMKENTYQQITQEEAKKMMEEQEVLILDVREQNEYDSEHILDAVLLPAGTITEETAEAVIGEKDTTVLVYCRSGNRSKTASQALVNLGYTNIYEFGGINTWPYEKE